MTQNKMREEMSAAFIAALKEDKIPWRRGWEDDLPVNAVTGKKYRSNNMVWLSYLATEKEYKDPRWCTYKQAADSGWQVKKGEKGAHIEFWSLYDTVEKKKLTYAENKKLQDELPHDEYVKRVKPISNVYSVFNGEQIDGIPEYVPDRKYGEINSDEILGYRDKLITNMDLILNEGGQSAFYAPSSDSITMPLISKFENSYEYMSTFLHECGHATGHEKRLHRDLSGTFGSESYAKEELRAEISSAFTTAELGINTGEETEHMKNHKAYIQSWVSVLENDPNELFRAIKDAEKISDYLIEKGEFKVKEETPEQETKLDYRLYQMNEGDKYHGFHFSPLEENKKFGTLTIDDYHSVYEGSFDDVSGASTLEKLESLFSEFQVSLPEGYTGYSMSTSDVVVITDKTAGTETAYYCDRYGFVEYPEFLQKKEVEQEEQPKQAPPTSMPEKEQLLKSLPDEPPEDVRKEAERELAFVDKQKVKTTPLDEILYISEPKSKTRTLYTFLPENDKKEEISVEISEVYPDNNNRNSITNLWKSAGYTDKILDSYLDVTVYVKDENGISEKYNPTVKTEILPKENWSAADKPATHMVLNFDNVYEVTEDNKVKLLEMVAKEAFGISKIKETRKHMEEPEEIIKEDIQENTKHELTFAEQVDMVIADKMEQYNSLKVCDTPQILVDVGLRQLPMLYTQRHLRDALHPKSVENSHWHGMTVEQIKRIPELLTAPAIIFDSVSEKNPNSIGIVLNAVDNDNAPIMVTVKPNGIGIYELEQIESNFITSIYGKDTSFNNYIDRIAESDKILFIDKEKSQELFSCLRLQLPQAINNLNFNKIIHQSETIVNSQNENNMKDEVITMPENKNLTTESIKYDAAAIEKEIPDNMRFKEAHTTLKHDGGIYWVTEDAFSYADLQSFQAAMIKFDIPKAYITVRDLSGGYDFKYDKENSPLIEITQDKINYKDFNSRCEAHGDSWYCIYPNIEDEQIKEKNFTYHGTDYEVIDRWQDSTGKYVIGQTIDANGVWYAAKVTDNTEQYKGVYKYEFDKRPSHKEVEGEHIDNIAQIDLDRYEAEYGADGRRAFPRLSEPELTQPELITYGILKDPETPGLMEDSYIVVEHTKTSGEHKAYDPLAHVVYKGSQKDCTDIKEKLTNKEITTSQAKELMSTAAKESADEKVINEFETFEKTHKEKIKAAQAEHVTIVINAFAGPGAGKTVACMDICAELKKAGYNAEYVQEYAKELVYEGDMEKLNGSIESQWEIFKEQVSRVDRLIGKTDFIVTDSPALLSPIYLADNTSREAYLFEKFAAKTHEHYNNFSFFLKRDDSSFQEEGRIHNFEESKMKDKEIKACLKRNNIFCCTYSRENVSRISENAELTYKRIKENPPMPEKEQNIKKKNNI